MTQLRPFFLPLLVLTTMLSVTWLAWDHEQQNSRMALRSQFDFLLRETVSHVEQHISGHEQMLRGVQGLFATTDIKDQSNFREYIDSLQLDANFSAIRAIGVIELISEAHKKGQVAAMRRLGSTTYAIKPAGQRKIYTPIIPLEHSAGSKFTLSGLDQWTDPVRRSAMEKARDSGVPAISGMVQLAVDNEAVVQPGFIMYLPIYARGRRHDSETARRSHLIGWVFAEFNMHNLMASLYGEKLPGLALAVYDDVEPSASKLLYSSVSGAVPHGPSTIFANEYFVVAGRSWMLSMSTLENFDARFGRNAKLLIVIAGASLSLILALLAWLLANGRERALRLATTMTGELHRQIDEYQVVQTLLKQANSTAESANSRIKKQSEIQGRFLDMVSHEYRTPLAIIRANVDIMELKEQQSGHGVSKSLNNIQHAIDRLVDVFEATQRRKDLDMVNVKLVFETIDIEQLIKGTLVSATAFWGDRFVFLNNQSLECNVSADRRLLRTVLLNLLDNAAKYSPPDIPVTLHVGIKGDLLEIVVHNNTFAPLPADSEVLFQEFSRGSNSAGTGGTGQGLYLARGIVEQHGGSLILTIHEHGDVVALLRLPLTDASVEPQQI